MLEAGATAPTIGKHFYITGFALAISRDMDLNTPKIVPTAMPTLKL